MDFLLKTNLLIDYKIPTNRQKNKNNTNKKQNNNV